MLDIKSEGSKNSRRSEHDSRIRGGRQDGGWTDRVRWRTSGRGG